MRYELMHSEFEQDGHRAIKIRDSVQNKNFTYYTEEIPYIKEKGLRAFLFPFLKDINDGYYDI
ncbi:hypothetical protein [Halobacillus amylolyticus]|uniref:Uncharacterized protein n=1 Tax=Halobacillus amylolyticus TaxID=2932259 RepID=A0ABY4HFD8_9BACI|nr:hypothetical protein [Halobacillus amylolyticus]UOR13598.1 hypothetical protein MUO15_09175 [Halobacillus amylolyticus]